MAYEPFDSLVQFDGGANSRDFVDNLAKNQSPNPRGVDLMAKSIQKALGFKTYGIEPDAASIGFTLYPHRVFATTQYLVKTIGTTIKYLDKVSGTWLIINTGTYTPLKRWAFVSFNGYMYGGNGVDSFVRWRASASSTLSAPVAIGDAVVNLNTGEGTRFGASGTGLIEGDDFTWTGVTGDQLTGVSGIAANHALGAAVITQLESFSGNPKGSVMIFFGNRIFVRSDANPNFYYFSKIAQNSAPQDDLANFTIAGSGAGDAGFMIFPAPVLGAKVFITGGNTAAHVVFCADGIAYSVTVTDSGSTTIAVPTPFKVVAANLVSSRAIAVTENDLVFLDDGGNIRSIGYGDSSTTVKTDRLSDDIDVTMQACDFSQSAMEYYDRAIYTLGRQNGSQSNNFTVVRQTNPGGFTFYDHWQLNDLAQADGVLYGLSSTTGNVYALNAGYSVNGGPILSSYPVAGLDHGFPLRLKTLLKMRISGYITNSCKLYLDAFLDENGIPKATWLISGDNVNITSTADNVAVGTVRFGSTTEGGQLPGGTPGGVQRKKFIATLMVSDFEPYYVLNMLFRNNQSNVDFSLDKILIYGNVWSPDVDRNDNEILAAS